VIIDFQNSQLLYPWSWTSLYKIAGVSRQAVHKYKQRKEVKLIQISDMIKIVEKVRSKHKKMGLKKIYSKYSEEIPVGRELFLSMMLQRGYGIRRKRRYHITTKSMKNRYFSNLIKGMKLRAANRVWQSDITYFKYEKRHLYLTLIIDVYTRYIVGYHLDVNMLSETMINALKMALDNEQIGPDNDLIHHSDRGSQYGSDEYVKLLKSYNIEISMCLEAYENAYAERLNQTIKSEYLDFVHLDKSKPLTQQIKNEIKLYNEDRPHWNLPDEMTPIDFKNFIKTLPINDRPEMTLYTEVLDPQDQGLSPDSVLEQTEESALPDVLNQVEYLLISVN